VRRVGAKREDEDKDENDEDKGREIYFWKTAAFFSKLSAS
jgi:hypothetical protein